MNHHSIGTLVRAGYGEIRVIRVCLEGAGGVKVKARASGDPFSLLGIVKLDDPPSRRTRGCQNVRRVSPLKLWHPLECQFWGTLVAP